MTIKIAAIGIENPGGMVTPCVEAVQRPRWFGLMLLVLIGDDDEFDVGRRIVYQLIDFNRIRAHRRRKMIMVDPRSLEEFRRSGRMT